MKTNRKSILPPLGCAAGFIGLVCLGLPALFFYFLALPSENRASSGTSSR